MDKIEAKNKLIDRLVEDRVNCCMGDSGTSQLTELVKHGFQGFANMTLDELQQATYDAGLHERDENVLEYLDVLGINKRKFKGTTYGQRTGYAGP